MKIFKLSIFKGHELKAAKNGFWSESPYRKSGKNWMGTKRIR